MNIPGMGLVRKARRTAESGQRQANEVQLPMTQRLGLVDFFKELFQRMGRDHIRAFAGNLTYHGLFALFPFLVFLVSLLGIFHATSLVDTLIKRASPAMPKQATSFLTLITHSVTQSHDTATFTVSAVIAILVSLWAASGGFRAVMEAMNVMYEVRDSRPFWKKYAISILMSVVVTVLLIAALVLVAFGPAIGRALANQLGVGAAFRWAWNILQWPALLAFLLVACALLYYFAPDTEQQFQLVSLGSLVAVGVWLLFSLLFSLYVTNFGSFNRIYGTLAGLVILLLYFYYSAFFLLLGAEMNRIFEAHAPGGKKAPGQTDERNTRA